ncbi:MAG: M56 family metallopeptidase, partial [Bacteroidota bacterium]
MIFPIDYFLKVNAVLLALAAVYHLAFHRVNLPVLKRFFLLGGSLLALLLPLIRFRSAVDGTLANYVLTEFTTDTTMNTTTKIWSMASLLWFAYASVALFFFARIVYGLLRLLNLKRRSVPHLVGNTLVHMNPSVSHTFSFASLIFSPSVQLQEEVLLHEQVHIKRLHTADNVFFALLTAVCWINPAVFYLARKSTENHEYEVDRVLIQRGTPAATYTESLIAHVLHHQGVFMTHSFSAFQILKTRITMMNTQSSKRAAARLLYVLPATALALVLAQACSKNAPQQQT